MAVALLTSTLAAPIGFGADSIGRTTTPRFLCPGFTDELAEVDAGNYLRMTHDGVLQNLHLIHNTVGVGAALITYTVEVEGVLSSLAVGLLPTAALGANTTTQVAVNKGDRVRIQVTKAGAITMSPRNIYATLEIA